MTVRVDGCGDEEDRLARVALNALTEPGDPRLGRLVAALGAAEVHDRLLNDTDLAGLRSETSLRLAGLEPRRILEEARLLGLGFVVPGDAAWPDRLDDLTHVEPLNRMAGAPLGLWVKGDPAFLVGGPSGAGGPEPGPTTGRTSAVAVVGSRSATTYGAQVARDLAAEVSQAGLTIVSGAAFGIDQAAHRGALAVSAPTVAVLACGLDRAYPQAHRDLLEYVAATGLVVSELRHGCSPTRSRFLSRNRLIAALTGGTVVVEAAVRSGALNTASWAARLHRVLMGVPGPVTSAPSEGVHELVRAGEALLVTRGAHVVEALAPMGSHALAPAREPETARDRLSTVQARILEAVPIGAPVPSASVARTAGLGLAAVRSGLEELARLGWVEGGDDRWRQCHR